MKNVYNRFFEFLILITLFNGCVTKKDLARINNQLEESEKAIKELQKDNDSDGVPDYKDLEPDTPSGERVDSQGRTVDSDGDGIPDHLDECPFNPGPASTKGCPPDNTVEMPTPPKRNDEFWPIPKPTIFETVTEEFKNLSNENTLEDAYIQIRNVIAKRGKNFNKIMYVPRGFALFTKVEKINDNGHPINGTVDIESGGCRVDQIIHCLFGFPSGRYRFFGFIVSNIDEVKTAIDDIEYSKLISNLAYGSVYNTSYFKNDDNNPINFVGYKIHLIVYEYETYPGGLPKLVSDSNINHLKHIF